MIRYIYIYLFRFCVDLLIIYRGLIFLIAYDLGYTWQIIVVWLLIWGLYYQPPNRTVGHLEIMGKKAATTPDKKNVRNPGFLGLFWVMMMDFWGKGFTYRDSLMIYEDGISSSKSGIHQEHGDRKHESKHEGCTKATIL